MGDERTKSVHGQLLGRGNGNLPSLLHLQRVHLFGGRRLAGVLGRGSALLARHRGRVAWRVGQGSVLGLRRRRRVEVDDPLRGRKHIGHGGGSGRSGSRRGAGADAGAGADVGAVSGAEVTIAARRGCRGMAGRDIVAVVERSRRQSPALAVGGWRLATGGWREVHVRSPVSSAQRRNSIPTWTKYVLEYLDRPR
jgi:hypothetical protein